MKPIGYWLLLLWALSALWLSGGDVKQVEALVNPDLNIGLSEGCLITEYAYTQVTSGSIACVSGVLVTGKSRVMAISYMGKSATSEIVLRDAASVINPATRLFRLEGSTTSTEFIEFERPIYMSSGLVVYTTNANVILHYVNN